MSKNNVYIPTKFTGDRLKSLFSYFAQLWCFDNDAICKSLYDNFQIFLLCMTCFEFEYIFSSMNFEIVNFLKD